MGYENSASTLMLATNCVCCGRPLVDAVSVEMGIGPECRKGAYPENLAESHGEANKLVYEASKLAQAGAVEKVLEISKQLKELGFDELSKKVATRFKNAPRRMKDAKIIIEETEDGLLVKTPYRRGESQAFINAWREIPGRKYDRVSQKNIVPKEQKPALWNLLTEFFPGKWGNGPKGVFRVPKLTKVEKKPEQLELKLENEDE